MRKIIIDTDMGSDCDDAGALALAHILHNEQKCKILGITYTTTLKNGPIAIDIINQYFHNILPIGANKNGHYFDGENTDTYVSKLVNRFASVRKQNTEIQDAVVLLRKLLANNKHVTLICIGQLINLSRLYDSREDDISPLTGKELVKQSVDRIVIMGGLFKQNNQDIYFHGQKYGEAEYNIKCDLNASKNVIRNLNVKAYFIDFLLGYQIFTGKELSKYYLDNPISYAYHTYCNGERESWDLLAVYYAILGDSKFLKSSLRGRVELDKQGVTSFYKDDKGLCYIVKSLLDEKELENEIDKILLKSIKEA